jgi:serine/threonine protein kinase
VSCLVPDSQGSAHGRPKALISDFGTSEEMLRGKRERTGHTGTMEYMAPETLVTDAHGQWRPSDSHADMWSLGEPAV